MNPLSYDSSRVPPAPAVDVRVRKVTGGPGERVRLIVDSGADITVVPADLIQRLDLKPKDSVLVSAFGVGGISASVYDAEISMLELSPIIVEVLASPVNSHYVLGRDVLNRYRIILDGPRQTLEIG